MTHVGNIPSKEALKLNATTYIVHLLKDGFDAGRIVTKILSQFSFGNPQIRLLYPTTKASCQPSGSFYIHFEPRYFQEDCCEARSSAWQAAQQSRHLR